MRSLDPILPSLPTQLLLQLPHLPLCHENFGHAWVLQLSSTDPLSCPEHRVSSASVVRPSEVLPSELLHMRTRNRFPLPHGLEHELHTLNDQAKVGHFELAQPTILVSAPHAVPLHFGGTRTARASVFVPPPQLTLHDDADHGVITQFMLCGVGAGVGAKVAIHTRFDVRVGDWD